MHADPHKLAVTFWINLLFAAIYAKTPLLLPWGGLRPAIDPLIPVPAEARDRYQPLWTIPWGLATCSMTAGNARLPDLAGRRVELPQATFEMTLALVAVGWMLPGFVIMWLPVTSFQLMLI